MPVRYVSRYAPPALDTTPTVTVPARSHAAAYGAIAVLLLGLFLSRYGLLFPALLGLLLLGVGLSFLSTRLNPFSVGFYLNTKPSWSSIGLLFLSAFLLAYLAYFDWRHGGATGLPRIP